MDSSSSPTGFKDSNGELIELENLRNKGQVSTELVTTTRTLLGRSEFSKPKSRMVESPYPKDENFVKEKTQMKSSNSSARNSPNKKVAATLPRDVSDATLNTPRTPLIGTLGEEDDEDEKVYKSANIEVHKLQHMGIWGLELWKWCVPILVILCGRLFIE
ncbi:Mechanosensitive ion channel protein 10 [Sesbania bispinosa]|nr:Mechanosensitive ion channel protein 10 [Sesbania bispinosa]